MKALRITLFSLFFSLFALSLFADGIPPSEEDVCDPLLSDLVTPGLFNLCNAYCEAKDCDDDGPLEEQSRSCQNIYWNFVDQAIGPNDPVVEPPESLCLAVETHDPGSGGGGDVPSCICWAGDDNGNNIPDSMEAQNLPVVPPPSDPNDPLSSPSVCSVDGGSNDASYDDALFNDTINLVWFGVQDSTALCFYSNSITGEFVPLDGLTQDEVDECIASVYWLQTTYFEPVGVECSLLP